jgi:DNA-binding response OmpR family regulator
MVASPECERKVRVAGLWVGLTCETAPLEEFFRSFYARRPELVLFDVIDRPDAFLTAILKVRAVSEVPLVVLALDPAVGMKALSRGVDFTMTAPVNVEELKLRLTGLLKRSHDGGDKNLLADEFIEVDRIRHQVKVLGQPVALTPTELRMLAALAERPGIVLSHEELRNRVWGDAFRSIEEVKLYVSYLRRKLRSRGVDAIETVRGVGYRYKPRLATGR